MIGGGEGVHGNECRIASWVVFQLSQPPICPIPWIVKRPTRKPSKLHEG